MPVLIRHATLADAQGILPIYNHAALETTAIWNDAPSDLAGRIAWMEARQGQGFPILVGERDGLIVGYASFGPFRQNDGYRNTVENSIYVHPQAQRAGIGRALLAALISEAQSMHKHVMVAGIDASNRPSIDLHAAFGFKEVGLMPQVGCKFGRWLDLLLMQVTLEEASVPPR